MKELLVSWYGITDFKASLGIEGSGPLLGAISTTLYNDIQILGYTANNKTDFSLQEKFDYELKLLNKNNKEDSDSFVYKWANTSQAHRYFIDWLRSKAIENNQNITIGFTPVSLKKLNDTEGIYAAVYHLLESIVKNNDCEKTYVTFFLSPGTPVMAFCWAMAALKFPQFKKRLIASSDPRKEPENIALPQEWMEWYGKQMPLEDRNGKYFDVIFHLYGEQRIPSYLGLKQFNCKRHVFVTSDKYQAINVMRQFVKEDVDLSELNVEPYNPKNVQDSLLKFMEEKFDVRNLKIGFNLTGGTKLMYAGALNVCRQLGGIPFYFNTREKRVLFLNDFSSKPITKIQKVESFIKLNSNGLSITDVGRKDSDHVGMIELTNLLWQKRDAITSIASDLKKKNFKLQREFSKEGLYVFTDNHDNSYIAINNSKYPFENISSFKTYLLGGWFEEYVYNNLQKLLKTKKIIDLRHSVKISYENKNGSSFQEFLGLTKTDSNQLYQELDVVFSDGYRLYIVECKTGKAEVEHVMKLENIVRYYGGSEAKGILVYANKVNNSMLIKKVEESKNVKLLDDDIIISRIEEFLTLYE